MRALAEKGWLADRAIAVAEIAAHEDFAAPEGFKVLEERRVGAGRFVMMRYCG